MSEHAFGHQPRWPVTVTREQMRSAAEAELKQIETQWLEMERASAGVIDTAETGREPERGEGTQRTHGRQNVIPKSEGYMSEEQPVSWHGRNLGSADAIMDYRGRIHIDSIRGSVYLMDLDGTPLLEDVLWSDDYEAEIRIIRRIPRQNP